MFESADGFKVSFTRQSCGIGSDGGAAVAPRPRPSAAGGAAPDGGGGGVKMPAGTTSAARIVTCGVESAFRPSHGVDALTRRRKPKVSMRSPADLATWRPLRLKVIHPTAYTMGARSQKPMRLDGFGISVAALNQHKG